MVNLPAFNPPPAGRAADLGWLLQNTQASDEEVCIFLLDVLRGELERFTAAFLHSPVDAITAVEEAIAWAVANRNRYSSEVSGKAWLFEHIAQECEKMLSNRSPGQRAVDAFDQGVYFDANSRSHYDELLQSLEKESVLLLVLHYGHDLSPEEIAYILRLPIEQVQAGFQQNRERLADHQRVCPICASSTGGLAVLETLLRKALPARTPIFGLEEAHLAHWRASILQRSTHQQAERRSRSRFKQTVQAGLFLVLLGIGWLFAGRVSSARPPALPAARNAPLASASPLSRTRALPGSGPLPTPIPTTRTVPIPPSSSPSLAEILRLASNSHNTWHTLWADVQVARYDLVGNGAIAQRVMRKQIWISQPALDRAIIGLLDGLPSITYAVIDRNLSGQSLGNGQIFSEYTSELVPDTDLQKLFVPEDMFMSGGTFTIAGRGIVDNRPAWVLEWTAQGSHLYRYWIDAQYGVILRSQEIDGQDLKTVIADTLVDAIIFNAPFPPEVFELQQYKGDLFAADFSGAPEIPDLASALASHSPVNAPANTTSQRSSGGNLSLSCERSPDGSKLAYTMPVLNTNGNTALRVLDLSGSQPSYPVLPSGITAGDYAFSPDSHRIAFFGCEKASGFCGVFLLDTQSAKLTRLLPITYADYIFWKPDGRYLALVGKDDTSKVLAQKASTTNMLTNEIIALTQEWHFHVIEVSTGKIVYKRVFEWAQMKAPLDSPTNTWDTPFKSHLPGPGGCAIPAGNN